MQRRLRSWERLRDEHGVEVSERQLCRCVRVAGIRRLALAARMAADTAVRDSIVLMPSAARRPEVGPHGERWGRAPAAAWRGDCRGGFVGGYWPGSVESFFGVLGLRLAVMGAFPRRPRRTLAGKFVHAAAATARPHAPARGWDLQVRASPGVRGRELAWTWLVACRRPARPRPDRALAVLFDLCQAARGGGLIERFPVYACYRARTPRRFVPWLY